MQRIGHGIALGLVLTATSASAREEESSPTDSSSDPPSDHASEGPEPERVEPAPATTVEAEATATPANESAPETPIEERTGVSSAASDSPPTPDVTENEPVVDTEAPYRAFRAYRDGMNRTQLGTGLMLTGMGLGLIGGGVALHANDSRWGATSMVGGAAVLAGAGIGMLLPNVAQSFGRKHDVDGSEHTVEESRAFEEAWVEHAREMKRTRRVSGGIGIGLGLALAGWGVAIATEAVSSDTTNERDALSALLIGVGVWNVGAGIGSFVWESPSETSLRVYQEGRTIARESKRLQLGLLPAPAGAQLGAVGTF